MKTSLYTFFEKTIIDSIDLESYELSNEIDLYDKIKTIYDIFRREYVHKNNQHIKETVLFVEWLQGLPNVLTVPFYNSNIISNALLNGFDLSNEDKEDTFLNSYWINLSKAFFTLKDNL